MTRTRDTLLLGALLVAAALTFDVPSLDVAGVALLLLGTICELWVRAAARDVSVERDLALARVVEDAALEVGVVVRGTTIGAPSGELVDPFLAGQPALLQPGRRVQRFRIRARFGRRGRRSLAPPAVIVRDPLGMAQRTVRGSDPAEILVLPRTEPLVIAADVGGRRPGPWLRSLSLAADVDLDGLRPYRPGTSASRIYWPGLARGGELSERRLSSGSDERPLVVLDARGAVPEDLDAAVRAAASICRHLAQLRGCRLGLPGQRRPLDVGPGLRGWDVALTQLALVERGGGPSASALAQRRGLLIWVSAQRLRAAPQALVRSGAGTQVLVVPGAVAGAAAAFTVAGCTGHVLRDGRRTTAGADALARAAP